MLLTMISLLVSKVAFASATADEFIRCNKLAVTKLESCLDNGGEACWAQSKASYDACHEQVIQNHLPNRERMEAEKSAHQTINNEYHSQ